MYLHNHEVRTMDNQIERLHKLAEILDKIHEIPWIQLLSSDFRYTRNDIISLAEKPQEVIKKVMDMVKNKESKSIREATMLIEGKSTDNLLSEITFAEEQKELILKLQSEINKLSIYINRKSKQNDASSRIMLNYPGFDKLNKILENFNVQLKFVPLPKAFEGPEQVIDEIEQHGKESGFV